MRDADVLKPAGESTAWPDDAIEVGRIIDAWGVKGGFKVLPFSNEPDALLAARRWYLKADEARVRPTGAAPLPPALSIRSARDHGDVIVATSPEIADRNAAEALKGARVFVSRTAFPAAGEGEYYWIDLIGLSVVNRAGEALGTVEGLLDTGAHSVLRVSFDAGGEKPGERLIPFVDAYVDQVDLPGRRIVVDWGLDY